MRIEQELLQEYSYLSRFLCVNISKMGVIKVNLFMNFNPKQLHLLKPIWEMCKIVSEYCASIFVIFSLKSFNVIAVVFQMM